MSDSKRIIKALYLGVRGLFDEKANEGHREFGCQFDADGIQERDLQRIRSAFELAFAELGIEGKCLVGRDKAGIAKLDVEATGLTTDQMKSLDSRIRELVPAEILTESYTGSQMRFEPRNTDEENHLLSFVPSSFEDQIALES